MSGPEIAAVFQPVGRGVYAVDTQTVRSRADASYLIVESGHAAFVDTGTHHSVPNLLATLAALDLDPRQVEYIVLTHVHLDHAGGAGRLAAALPGARVLVHPRGAAHLIAPARLIDATQAVYGKAEFVRRFGDVVAIEAPRVGTVEDGERLALGARTLEFLHTPGHALHHLCIADRDAREVFTGDTFGVSYRETDTAAGAFIFPTTTPAQFDPEQLHASIERIATLACVRAYLTHYGPVEGPATLERHLHEEIDAFVGIAHDSASHTERIARMRAQMFSHLSDRLDAHGFAGDERARHALLDGDVALNCAGLDAWLRRIA